MVVAIVSDDTRVLGLGNVRPEGALPVMEGNSVLFKILGVINATHFEFLQRIRKK